MKIIKRNKRVPFLLVIGFLTFCPDTGFSKDKPMPSIEVICHLPDDSQVVFHTFSPASARRLEKLCDAWAQEGNHLKKILDDYEADDCEELEDQAERRRRSELNSEIGEKQREWDYLQGQLAECRGTGLTPPSQQRR